MDEIPVARMTRLLRQINRDIDDKKWDDCASRAKEVMATLRLAIQPETSQTGKPHLDGVYTVGTMRYIKAPDDVQRLLNRMNRIIRTAQQTLR